MYESTGQHHSPPVAEYEEAKSRVFKPIIRERAVIIREHVSRLILHMKQQNEVEKLLSLIFQSGGKIEVKDGRLWIAPVDVAQRFGEQIKKLKPEILLALGHCPVCARELIVKVEELPRASNGSAYKEGRHAYCSGQEILHYDSWKF